MQTLLRKKGRNKYYYLQHSFRDGKKVITKEVYLGKKIPKDLEKKKEKLKSEEQKILFDKLESIKKHFQAEWKKLPLSVKEREKQEIAIAFTYHTNAIEGSTITQEEVREIIQDHIAPHKPLRDIKETEAHCILFLDMLEKKESWSNILLLEWHKKLFKETKSDIAGCYRDYLVRVGSYRAPDWQDVKKLMNQLIVFLKDKSIHPVLLAARAHYRFEKVHPFGDGNGRVGRLIMNHILWYQGYPMLIIEYSKRRSYYKALEKDEDGFVKYFIRRYLSVHKKRIAN
ncbi:hypothetical protein CL622_00715 [archaeon]|nr:hypothetical protein [archaeon]